MKRTKIRAYLVECLPTDEFPKPDKPVFVQAWTPLQAIHRAVRHVMRWNQMYATIKVMRLRVGFPADHYSLGFRKYEISRKPEIEHIVESK